MEQYKNDILNFFENIDKIKLTKRYCTVESHYFFDKKSHYF